MIFAHGHEVSWHLHVRCSPPRALCIHAVPVLPHALRSLAQSGLRNEQNMTRTLHALDVDSYEYVGLSEFFIVSNVFCAIPEYVSGINAMVRETGAAEHMGTGLIRVRSRHPARLPCLACYVAATFAPAPPPPLAVRRPEHDVLCHVPGVSRPGALSAQGHVGEAAEVQLRGGLTAGAFPSENLLHSRCWPCGGVRAVHRMTLGTPWSGRGTRSWGSRGTTRSRTRSDCAPVTQTLASILSCSECVTVTQ